MTTLEKVEPGGHKVAGTKSSMASAILPTTENHAVMGWWNSHEETPTEGMEFLGEAIRLINVPFYVVLKNGSCSVARVGTGIMEENKTHPKALPVLAYVPSCPLVNLGDPSFCNDYGINYPYIAGSMAHGISSVDMVRSLSEAGMLAFFGTAGLSLNSVESAIEQQSGNLRDKSHGYNLIHTPNEPQLESLIVDLFIKKGVRLVEASAYLGLTLPLVRYRVHGIHTDSSGNIVTPNRIIAKVSRIEVASKFFSPPPENILRDLINMGEITGEQASLAEKIPMARDLTAEADSGGHTDNRPAIALLPTMIALRDRMQKKHEFSQRLRVGAAGGISTPAAAAAMFSMGAAYVLTGSVNQACVESGASDVVRQMLANTGQADVTMAPAADMFEMGVKVQVMKRGTMFPMRSAKLYELYNTYDRIENIPSPERAKIEKLFFRASLDEAWNQTCAYFRERDPTQLTRAQKDPRYKMSLIFRWYLGQSSHWAIAGDLSRRIDYQVWCGPSMGAFNEWAKGSFLEDPANRKVVTIALNLLHGAAVIMRLNALKCQGLNLLTELNPIPITESKLIDYL